MRDREQGSCRTVVDQIDLEHLVPGGTDTCISDLVVAAAPGSLRIVGITAGQRPLGVWQEVRVRGTAVPFLAVARLDRAAPRGLARWLPHSLLLTAGVIRYRHLITDPVVQAHRIEVGALLTVLCRGRALVQFIHNDSAGLLGRNSDSTWRFLGPVYRGLERLVLRRARKVVLFNQTDAPRLAELRPDLTVAQTWFDPSLFFPRSSHPTTTLRVLWVGRLDQQKDPLLIVDVALALAQHVPTFRIEVVGAGPLESALRTALEAHGLRDTVHLLGPLSRTDVAATMRDASVLLMTSHYEGSPRVLVEANAVGLPVVATTGADPDEALDGRQNGIRTSRAAADLARSLVRAATFDRDACAASVSHRSSPQAVTEVLAL